MTFHFRILMAAALAIAGVAAIQAPEAAAQQAPFQGKKGGGHHSGKHHGGKHHGGKHHGGRHRGGKVAGGIAAGIAAGLILNEIAKSQAAPDEREYRGGGDGLSCRELRFRCEDGRDWACRRHARRC